MIRAPKGTLWVSWARGLVGISCLGASGALGGFRGFIFFKTGFGNFSACVCVVVGFTG